MEAPAVEAPLPLNTGQCIAAVQALTDSSTFAEYERWYFSAEALEIFSTPDCFEAFPKVEFSAPSTQMERAAILCSQSNTERGLFVTTASVQNNATQIRIGAAVLVPFYSEGEPLNTWAVRPSAQVMLADIELSLQPNTLLVLNQEFRWVHSTLKPKCELPH